MATSLGLVGHEMYSGASSYFFPPGGLVPADGNNGAVLEFPPAAVAEADFFLPEIMGARGDRPHDYYCSPPAQVFAANNVGGGAPENDMTMNMSYVYDDGRRTMSSGSAGNVGGRASPRIGFRTRTEVDVLDDGFKWRKYGKKAVKSSPNPRNYYRCSAEGCGVKKRVERDRDDPRYVVTTYDGVHNHAAPGAAGRLGLGTPRAAHGAPWPASCSAPWGAPPPAPGAPCDDAWGTTQLHAAAVAAAAQAQASHSSESSY